MAQRNIDFNEARAKGLVAPNEIAQQEVIKLAGGKDVFKPESWWNEQLTKQVNAKDFKNLLGFIPETRFGSPGGGFTSFGAQYTQGPPGVFESFTRTEPTGFFGSVRTIRYNPAFQDVTLDVLRQIKKQSKASLQSVQRESGELGATRKRLSRVTGGLLAGAKSPSMDSLSAGPMLGDIGELGSETTLGRRTRI